MFDVTCQECDEEYAGDADSVAKFVQGHLCVEDTEDDEDEDGD